MKRILDDALASRREAIFGLLATLSVVDVAGAILDRRRIAQLRIGSRGVSYFLGSP